MIKAYNMDKDGNIHVCIVILRIIIMLSYIIPKIMKSNKKNY